MKNIRSKRITSPNRLNTTLDKTNIPWKKLNTAIALQIKLNEKISPIIQQLTNINSTVIRYHNGTLSLSVENQSQANHIYYLKSSILHELQKQHMLQGLLKLECIVITKNYLEHKQQTSQKTKTQVSLQTAQHIEQAAKHISADNVELKQALHELANNMKKKDIEQLANL